jgi:hypothetical protein
MSRLDVEQAAGIRERRVLAAVLRKRREHALLRDRAALAQSGSPPCGVFLLDL